MNSFLQFSLPLFLQFLTATSREFTGGGLEYFSSIAHMATLQELEFNFIRNFKVELNSVKKWTKSDTIENKQMYNKSMTFLQDIENLHKISLLEDKGPNSKPYPYTTLTPPNKKIWRKDSVVEYDSDYNKLLANPINQYKLIDRMLEAWPQAIMEISEYAPNAKALYTNMVEKNGGLPSQKDLNGAAEALLRLQDTYQLDTKEFSEGDILGRKSNHKLSSENCFHIGQQAYYKEDYYHCILWMREALRKFHHENDQTHDQLDILDHLGYSLSQYGFKKLAFYVSLEANHLIDNAAEGTYDYTTTKRLRDNKRYYANIFKTNNVKGALAKFIDENELSLENLFNHKIFRPNRQYRFDEFDTYEELCRQDSTYNLMPQETQDKLYCKYDTQNNNPRLILKPAKVEYLRINPDFIFFHDVVSEEEKVIIKQIAKPKLSRATIQNPRTGNLEFAEYRVSKHAWLSPQDHKVIYDLNQRIMDYTGLDTRGLSSEELQVGDYGVGGQYEPHYDHATKGTAGDFGIERGNRVATVLLYFTETEAGGNTVFLQPKIAIPPIKNGAAFWYNLKPCGESDDSTRHAACPILVGQKWVANYWIHERGQEFRRKCVANEFEESSYNIDGWNGVGENDKWYSA